MKSPPLSTPGSVGSSMHRFTIGLCATASRNCCVTAWRSAAEHSVGKKSNRVSLNIGQTRDIRRVAEKKPLARHDHRRRVLPPPFIQGVAAPSGNQRTPHALGALD